MVSFRYHLVSLGAALLALAAGVILGAGPLSTKVSKALTPTKPVNTAAAAAAVSSLKARAAADDAFVAATAKSLVVGQLHKTRVVLVVAPGTPPAMVSAVSALLGQAGATVTGAVLLKPAWSDPAQATVLDGITSQLAPASTAITTTTTAGGGVDQASAALAAAVLTKQASALGQTSDPATALLAGLVTGGFLTKTGTPEKAASMAVFLAPANEKDPAALLPLMTALDAAGKGAVVAGATGSATAGGVLAVLRGDPAAKSHVSGVDSADLLTGRVALVLALAQRKAGGHGQYGTGPGADAPVPRR
jgi:Copper transport outer membrane protein, MctB